MSCWYVACGDEVEIEMSRCMAPGVLYDILYKNLEMDR